MLSQFATIRRIATAVLLLCVFGATVDRAWAQAGPIDAEELVLLSAPDLDSPQATFGTLRQNVEQAYALLIDAHRQHRSAPGFLVSSDVADKVAKADLHLRRAIATLDLSQVAAVTRQRTGLETVLLLKEILDRVPQVALDEVPGRSEVVAANAANTPLLDWRVPYTDIHISRIGEGPRAGQYLVSENTVARAPEYYASFRRFAPRPDASQEFFEFYALTPGNLLPSKWYLWIEELPEWTRATVAGETVWQWFGLLLVIGVLFGGYWVIQRRLWHHSGSGHASTFGRRIVGPLLLVGVCVLALGAIDELNISGSVSEVVVATVHAVVFAALAWLTYLVCYGISGWIVSSPQINPASLDASLIRLVGRTLGIAGGITVAFLGATQIGLPAYGLIAGLGVGGLALGLAARPTLENLIGGLILYADRPVRVGDFCQFGNKRGQVEEIGIRSTRIRARDRTVITVPNAEFSSMELVNYSRRDSTHLRTNVHLRYETTRGQMLGALSDLRQMLLDNPDVISESVRVRFNELGAYALGIRIDAYVARNTTSGLLEVQEQILLAIMKIVEDRGTAIALPSQTTYYRRDAGSLSKRDIEPSG